MLVVCWHAGHAAGVGLAARGAGKHRRLLSVFSPRRVSANPPRNAVPAGSTG